MFLGFCMVPAADGRGLCDIDRVLFRVSKSHVRTSQFLTRDLVTLKYTLSSSAGCRNHTKNSKTWNLSYLCCICYVELKIRVSRYYRIA